MVQPVQGGSRPEGPGGAGPGRSPAGVGLRTAAKLVADAGRTPPVGLRATGVEVSTDVGTALLRDQRLQARSRIEAHLDGIALAEWLGILDERAHLFARQKDVTAMLTRYQADGQDLMVFDTARLLAAGGDRVEVATVASAAPEAWGTCRCRGRDTFIPLALFDDPVADIEEVTVVGGIDDVEPMVSRVVRYHPDRSTEVVFERG
jgi:hypothetical protein